MKKLLTLTIGILLTSILFAQTPFTVDKVLKIENGDTITSYSQFDELGIKLKNSKAYGDIQLIFENSEVNLKKKTTIKVVDSKYFDRDDTKYICYSEDLGNIEIRHNFLTGYIKFDKDEDGEFEEIFVLK